MVCNALVAGGRLLGVEQQAMRPGWGKLSRIAEHAAVNELSKRQLILTTELILIFSSISVHV